MLFFNQCQQCFDEFSNVSHLDSTLWTGYVSVFIVLELPDKHIPIWIEE